MTITGFTTRGELITRLDEARKRNGNEPVAVSLPGEAGKIYAYPASVQLNTRGGYFFAGQYHGRQGLFIAGASSLKVMARYPGDIIARFSDFVVKKCRITQTVMHHLREDFPFCAPTSGRAGTYTIGLGDILGKACKAQIMMFSGIADILYARQCIHQLRAMDFHPQDALDGVGWSVFQEGYEDGFATEACRITTPEEFQEMLDAGYRRFSIEPPDSCPFSLRDAPKQELLEQIFNVPWIELRDKFELMFHRYSGKRIDLSAPELPGRATDDEPLMFVPSEQEVLAAISVFGEALHQLISMERVLVSNHCREEVTLEISFLRFGETLTTFEHYFVIQELLRHDVQPDYFAPGEITREHQLVAWHNGAYGLSGPARHVTDVRPDALPLKLHGVIPDFSYQTAVRCLAYHKPELFRVVWETARNGFEEARQGKQTDIKIQYIPSIAEFTDEDLPNLFDNEHTEAFLKLTAGVVMSRRDEHGHRYLRQKLYDFLLANESVYTDFLGAVYQPWAEAWEKSVPTSGDDMEGRQSEPEEGIIS